MQRVKENFMIYEYDLYIYLDLKRESKNHE